MKTQIRCDRPMWSEGVQILVMQTGPRGERYSAEPLVMKLREPGLMIEPTAELSVEEAQTLMDDLWRCGLRPTEGAGSAGSLLATQGHLADMRKIAFTVLKIKESNS